MSFTDLASLRRLFQQSILVALRIGSALSKFALTIYIARYLDLAALGAYSLLVGAATMAPAVLGFGLGDWTCRHIVRLSRDGALPFIVTRLSVSALLHCIVQPAAWMLNLALGTPIPWHLVFLIGAIMVLEHLGTDLYFLMVARNRARFASVVMFIRAGLWPPFVIAAGLLIPQMRTIETVMFGWLAALILMWLVIGLVAGFEQNIRAVRWHWRFLLQAIPQSVPFYLKDIGGASLLYLDRFLISAFLGLELTGVYTFFWSIASVIESLVYGLIQTHLPDLVGKDGNRDPAQTAKYESRLYRENAIWALLLAGAACVVVPLLLPFIGNVLLQDYLPLFWLIVFGALLHLAADAVGFLLYAARHDRAFTMIVLFGAPVSALANLVLVPTGGIYGAAAAYILTGIAILALGLLLKRRAQSQHA